SQIILSLTDFNKKAYRIGGDEFVLVIENPKEGELERLLEKWYDLIELKSKASALDLSAAIGYASGKGKNIAEIVRDADKKMYRDKSKQKKLVKMHKK
ncbi:MAG: diguanylate cyclase, partial [Agathobacter sp.]|nr:diguanylate cyclase [Agathobacter sp.]